MERRTKVMAVRTTQSVFEAASHAAAKQNRSISNYVERLVELDCGLEPNQHQNIRAARNLIDYAFRGRVIRIDRQTYEDWQEQFPNLPSLDVALKAADDAIAGDPPKNWFEPLVNWLKEQNDGASRN